MKFHHSIHHSWRKTRGVLFNLLLLSGSHLVYMTSLAQISPLLNPSEDNFSWKIFKDSQQNESHLSYTPPQVEINAQLIEDLNLNDEAIKQIKNLCLADYKKSRQVLEESLADVTISHPAAHQFIDEFSRRFYILLDKHAEVYQEKNYPHVLNIDEINDIKTIFINKILSHKIGTHGKDNKSTLNTGYVGTNPLSIRKVLTEGNFREKMYIIFKGGKYLDQVFRDKKLVQQINHKLAQNPEINWRFNQSILKDDPTYDPYTLGYFTQFRARKSHEKSFTYNWPKEHNQNIDDNHLRVPLSVREKRLMKFINQFDNPKIPWLPGGAWLYVETSASYQPKAGTINALPYLKASEETFSPQLAGISSTTDRILTTASYFGFQYDDLLRARLAALASMVDANDHSAHEILFASKSFHLPYQMVPQFYQDIYPLDKDFVSKLDEAQRKRGFELPHKYLESQCFMDKYHFYLNTLSQNNKRPGLICAQK